MEQFAKDNDIIVATEMAQAIGMHPWEIASNPEMNAKFKEIVDFLGPFEDKTFLVQKLTRGMMKDQAINHVWKYVGLRRSHGETKSKLDTLEKELRHYER